MTNQLLDAVMAALVAAPLLAVFELVRERHRRRESRRLARAVVEAQGYARQVQSEAAIERANVEHALRILWRRIEVVTPADGAAVAVLRAAFPTLPAPPGPRIPAHVSAAVDALNVALWADPSAIANLLAVRVPCNEALAYHPSIQVRRDDTGDSLGVLGLLNGCLGAIPSGPCEGWGWVSLLVDGAKPVRFEVTAPRDVPVEEDSAKRRAGLPLEGCSTCGTLTCPGQCDAQERVSGGAER
ncbi:hypothetical protein JKA73_10905 [Myxococcus xanthus]|uniref:hypothetical protein n=1 Tax=Myxococcus xanthus TaxID=34 RepID=UPI001917175D|nr:hypothetical protein [Myxococcus xanthus]QQR46537.1 hypothetical protein JKA73_10905 [Myxococcus xanthus]